MNKQYKILLLPIVLLLLSLFFDKNLVINIRDTYYVISYIYLSSVLLVLVLLSMVAYTIIIRKNKKQ
uniref:DUF3955 domain-containing protein n=1 Tax=Tenacibaculum sp. Pbs-1 TaxID=3238748 RepID=A0AB33L161_9FLAO